MENEKPLLAKKERKMGSRSPLMSSDIDEDETDLARLCGLRRDIWPRKGNIELLSIVIVVVSKGKSCG